MKKKNIFLIAGIVILIVVLLFIFISNKTVKEETIIMGVLTPLSGDCSVYGENVVNAKTLALEEINQTGGILGKQLKLIFEDGKCNSLDALSSARKLIEINNIKIIFGGTASSETLGAIPITEENKVILFSSGASSPEISSLGDYVFRNYPSEDVLGVATSELLYNDGYRKVAILVENTDYALSILNVFKDSFEKLGGSVVIIEKYNSDSLDFKTQLTKIKNSNVDSLLFLPQTGSSGGFAVKQAHELNIKLPYYGNAQMNGSEALVNGGLAINNLKFVDAPIVDTEKGMEFLNKYNERFGRPAMDYFVGAEYDAVYIIKDAIEYCKDIDTDCIKDYLYNLEEYNGVIGKYSFDENGDVKNIKFAIKQIIDAENDVIEIIN
ncbi:MAG: penicillin-binding protein activator [Candidatus Nanoarchaeia archaeon]|jgi:branched-chain amino acid transport system substrate-binding protein|nr:penicillin-binding protein activator [Candidatus Nanoarchaeia archaeon]